MAKKAGASGMKFTLLQENLKRALGIVNRAVAPRNTLPILSHVLLTSRESHLELATTNLEMSIRLIVAAEILTPGAVALPAAALYGLVAELPPGPIEFDLDPAKMQMQVRSGRHRANLMAETPDDFPLIDFARNGLTLQPDPTPFREAIPQAAVCAAVESDRPMLCGVLLRTDGKALTLAASDGFRLAVRTMCLSVEPEHTISVVMPAGTLKEVARVIDTKEPLTVDFDAAMGRARFASDPVEVFAQLIEGTYPDYSGIVPGSCETRTTLDTPDLLRACQMADIFAREASHTLRLTITPGDDLSPGQVQVEGSSALVGHNSGMVTGLVEGAPVQIGFNARYLQDALRMMDTDQIILETTSPDLPARLLPAGRDDYQQVIMPMTLQAITDAPPAEVGTGEA